MHPHVRRPTPGARAFGSARGLLRQRCGLSSFLLTLPPLKSNSGGWEHAAQAAATAAPPPSNHTGPLCVEWQIWTCKQLFIYVYKMERCVCGCVYDPRCQIKNNAGKKKKRAKNFFSKGSLFSALDPSHFRGSWPKSPVHGATDAFLSTFSPPTHTAHSCPPLLQQPKPLHCDCSNLSTAALTSPNVAIRA